MAIFRLDDYHWQPNFSNHTKSKQKISNYTQKSFRKSPFEVAVWRDFSVVARSIGHSLFYNGPFNGQLNFSNHIKLKLKTSN